MRIASFNLENLFDRAKALNLENWAAGKNLLQGYAAFNALIRKPSYSAGDRKTLVDLLKALKLERSDESEFFILRQNRGKLVRRPRNAPAEIVAGGRADWAGWLDLKRGPVNEIATQNTARVIKEVGADILAVIEAEDRIAIKRFNDQILGGKEVGGEPYEHVMLIDGNDERGIDVGLLTRSGFEVVSVQSHVDDTVDGNLVFSRDCPVYRVRAPGGTEIFALINHFKSKGFGSQASSNAKRKAQAKRVRAIYEELKASGAQRVAILGDFNDTPDSDPLSPLLKGGSDLKDVQESPRFIGDGRPGTFGNGAKSQKLDYILLSPKLFSRVTEARIFRKGVWGGTNGNLFEHFDTITRAGEAASDHAAIWADLAI